MLSSVYGTDWNLLFLPEDPFTVVPPMEPSQAKWAGLKKLKGEFDGTFREALTSSRNQLVLNWGPYGAGKTHASVYFKIEQHMPGPIKERVAQIYTLSTRTPKEPGQAAFLLYSDLLEQLQMERIRGRIRTIRSEVGHDGALEILQNLTGSEALGRAIWLLGDEEQEQLQQLLNQYFLSGLSPSQLPKLGIGRSIRSSNDRFRILATIFQCFIGLSQDPKPASYNRVFLWLDEAEDLTLFRSREYTPFARGLRDLFDSLPRFFTMFVNFTLAEPRMEPIEVVLGKALIDRVTKYIYFEEPNCEEGVEYVRELLDQNRTDKDEFSSLGLPDTYPFTEDAVATLLEDLSPRTPRSIHSRCHDLVMRAFAEGLFREKGKGIINTEYVNSVYRNRLDSENA